jgi:thiamine-monophosphate kinase
VSTDSAVEGVHFRREWFSPGEIGFRAITAALSDIAAMAAEPRGVLVSLVLPQNARDDLMALADGIGAAAHAGGTVIIGGNLSGGDALAITTTVLGSAFAPLMRSGARAGDLLYVTGALGGPRAALRALENDSTPLPALRERLVHPTARLAEARWLGTRGAVAGIDISDGLAGDAAHLAAASAVGIEIQLERVPVFAGATEDDAARAGEEFELLLASRAPLPDAEFAARFGIPLTLIGRAIEGVPEVHFTRDSRRVAAPAGYDHFSA